MVGKRIFGTLAHLFYQYLSNFNALLRGFDVVEGNLVENKSFGIDGAVKNVLK